MLLSWTSVLQMDELKPYNEASKAQRAERNNFDSRWSDLDFKNEQQLDETIASIDYRLSHETNSVADEKKLIAELKKLGVRPDLTAALECLGKRCHLLRVATGRHALLLHIKTSLTARKSGSWIWLPAA